MPSPCVISCDLQYFCRRRYSPNRPSAELKRGTYCWAHTLPYRLRTVPFSLCFTVSAEFVQDKRSTDKLSCQTASRRDLTCAVVDHTHRLLFRDTVHASRRIGGKHTSVARPYVVCRAVTAFAWAKEVNRSSCCPQRYKRAAWTVKRVYHSL